MRWLIKQFLFHLVALELTAFLIPGFSVGNSVSAIVLATSALALLNFLVKPILKIFFFPLNLLTLNLFSLVINVLVVFILTKLVPTVKISVWSFPGLTVEGLVLPPMGVSLILTYFISSLLLTFVVGFLKWLFK